MSGEGKPALFYQKIALLSKAPLRASTGSYAGEPQKKEAPFGASFKYLQQ